MRVASFFAVICSVVLSGTAGLATSHTAVVDSTTGAPRGRAKQRIIKLGFLTSLTGVGSVGGVDMLQGIRLYLSENGNRLGGHPVELIVEDDESNASVAALKLKKLVTIDKIDMLDGVQLSSVGYAIAPFVERYHLPAIYSVCCGDDLTQRGKFNWIVRSNATCSQPSHALGQWVYKHLHYKKVVTVAMDYPYGYESVGGFQNTFEGEGGQVVQKIWIPLGITDFSPWIKHIDRTADAIYLVAIQRAASVLPKQLRGAGITLPVIAGGGSFDETVLPKLGDECLNSISASVYSAVLERKQNQRFGADFRTLYHHDPSLYSATSYSSVMWIDKALTKIKGDVEDRTAVMDALRSLRCEDDPRGPVFLDRFGNPVENVYIRRVERVHGKLQNTVIDTIPAVSQFWSYQPSTFLKQPAYGRTYPPCRFCTHRPGAPGTD
ncbi:MAG TPA: ABC transporter substrate-binding protein [Candidatus Obscuribacterales bacterium]